MPYRPADTSVVLWDERGRPYWRREDGSRSYIPPASAMSMWDNPRALAWAAAQGYTASQTPGEVPTTNRPGGSLFRQAGVWNSDEGDFDRPINWSNILSMGVGGLIAAPLVAGAVAGGAGAGGASGAGAGGAGLATAPTVAGGVGSGVGGSAAGAIGGATATGPALLPAVGIPAASTAGGVGGATGVGGAAGTSLLSRVGDFSDKYNLPQVGAVLGGGVRSKEQERYAASQGLLGQQGLALQGARDQYGAGLSSAQFQSSEAERAKRAAMLVSLLGGMQDYQVTPGNPRVAAAMGTNSGGMRPSALSGRPDLMTLLGKLGTPIAPPTYQGPPPLNLPQASGFERGMDYAGLAASILGALRKR